jgi:hypothetical protein
MFSLNYKTQNLTVMTTQELASRLANYCREGQFETAQKELFSDDMVSIEPFPTPGFEMETKGREANVAKGQQFTSMVEEVHSIAISEPLITENIIAFTMDMDLTMKERGRTKMNELCVYTVKDGKIISEQFFY